MAVIKCKMCGGAMEIQPGQSVAACEYCGTMQTLPRLDDERKASLYDRASYFRRNNEFDRAIGIYEQILNADENDAESYWSLVLCRYGIEYVEDPVTRKRVPTVNRTQMKSIFSDEDYLSALRCADAGQRAIYEEEAAAIDEIRKGILAVSQHEDPFDVFLCYKETDSDGRRTMDSILATEVYKELTAEGYRVFFSRITLEDKLGVAYEPYIFAALNSAAVMIVVGTRPEYFNAVWVKNEWSRYLALINSGAKKYLIPAYRDMNPYDLPEEFAHLQAQDMSRLGFMQDLVRGVKKLTARQQPETTHSDPDQTQALLKRAFIFLEDGDWKSANDYCEKVLDRNPETAEAYVGKLLSELQLQQMDALGVAEASYVNNSNYQKAIRYADPALKIRLTGYAAAAEEQRELKRRDGIYQSAVEAERLSVEKARALPERIASAKKAIMAFQKISGHLDADERLEALMQQLRKLEKKHEETLKKAKRTRRIVIAAVVSVVLLSAAVFSFVKFGLPAMNYQSAIKAREAGKFEEAETAFAALGTYRDSENQRMQTVYEKGLWLLQSGKYTEAVTVLQTVGTYADAEEKIDEAQYRYADSLVKIGDYEDAIQILSELRDYGDAAERLKETKYQAAMERLAQKAYEEASQLFENLNYEDSEEMYHESLYLLAKAWMQEGKHASAREILIKIQNYKDSRDLVKECKYQIALQLAEAGNYDQAVQILGNIGNYRDANELENEYCRTAYQQFFQEGEYENALKYYRISADYDMTSELYLECMYQRGVRQMSSDITLSEAIATFGDILTYKDSNELWMKAMYEYVCSEGQEFSHADNYIGGEWISTYEMLKTLKEAGYEDSAEIFQEWYAWRVSKIVVNNDPEDTETHMTSISVYDPVYFHYELSGGPYEGEVVIVTKYSKPNGSTGSYTFNDSSYTGSTGWYGWANGIYTNPAYGQRGILKVDFYDDAGNLIGSASVNMVS